MNYRYRIFALLICITVLSPVPAIAAEINNGLLRLSFDDTTGQLLSFKDLRNGHDLIAAPGTEGLWKIDLMPGAAKPDLTPQDAMFAYVHADPATKTIVITWTHFQPDQLERLAVRATATLDDNAPMSRWRIAVEGLGKLSPAAIRFPRIANIAPQEDETLAVPVWMGERTTRARELLNGTGRFEWEYPGMLSMQCLALYRNNGPGLYAACDDTGARAKRFAVFGQPEKALGFELTQLPENGSGDTSRYESPYSVLLGTFEGDWFTAAERYRAWALQQSWATQSRLDTGAVADWVGKTGIWIWNRGRSEGVLGPAMALQERAQMPVSVFCTGGTAVPTMWAFPNTCPRARATKPSARRWATRRPRGFMRWSI